MFRFTPHYGGIPQDFPRVSGDVPSRSQSVHLELRFSPRERGCSLGEPELPAVLRIFPA